MLRCSFVGVPLAAPHAAPSPARRARCVAPRAAKGKGGGKADKGAKKARRATPWLLTATQQR